MNSKTATLGMALGLVASTALASNTGFKLNYQLDATVGKSQNNPISPPYFYYPDGTIGNSGDSKKLCRDLNDQAVTDPPTAPKVVQVLHFNVATDRFDLQSCTSPATLPAVFQLEVGAAYVAKPAAVTPVPVVNLVGSHDDAFAWNKLNTSYVTLRAPAGKSQNNHISVPYHVTANDSKQLCRTLNHLPINDPPSVPLVVQVLRFNPATDRYDLQSCSSPATLPAVFPLKPGEGYVAKPAGTNQDQLVSFEVY